jgi:hypothetical protein
MTLDDAICEEGMSHPSERTTTASYTTRRKKVWRQNFKANARNEARERYRPRFEHITVAPHPTFFRHFKPGLKFAAPDPLVQQYVSEHGLPGPGCDPGALCFMSVCDDAQMRHLRHFDRAPRELNPVYARTFNRARDFVSKILALPNKIPFPHAEDIDGVKYKPRKYPGAPYRVMGYANRGEAHEAAKVDARLSFAQLLAGEHVEPHPVRLGGRGKAVLCSEQQARENGTPKGRLVLMLSHRDLLLCGVTEQLATRAYCDEDYPVSLGMGWFCGQPAKFVERLIEKDVFFCMDAEKYDASLDPWLIREAVAILRQQFVRGMDEEFDFYWNFVIESLIAAPILRDDGWLMFKEVGTTSGHNHNSLIQSICTLLVGYTGVLSCLPEAEWDAALASFEMEALGDDNILGGGPVFHKVSCAELGGHVWRAFGINWLGEKSFKTDTVLDEDIGEVFSEEGRFKGVQYLGKFFREGRVWIEDEEVVTAIPYRPARETFVRMYYPERPCATMEHTYLRALGNLLDAYGNPLTARWLNGLLDWLEAQMEDIPESWRSDTVQDQARDYTQSEVYVPRPKRWSYEEWVSLILANKDVDNDWFAWC